MMSTTTIKAVIDPTIIHAKLIALFGRYWLIIVKKGTGFIVQNCEHVWNLMRNTIYSV